MEAIARLTLQYKGHSKCPSYSTTSYIEENAGISDVSGHEDIAAILAWAKWGLKQKDAMITLADDRRNVRFTICREEHWSAEISKMVTTYVYRDWQGDRTSRDYGTPISLKDVDRKFYAALDELNKAA